MTEGLTHTVKEKARVVWRSTLPLITEPTREPKRKPRDVEVTASLSRSLLGEDKATKGHAYTLYCCPLGASDPNS